MTNNTPAYDNDIEQVVLAALMVESRAIMENNVKAEWFYMEEHQIIAKTLLKLKAKGINVDMVQTVYCLKSEGALIEGSSLDKAGGLTYISKICQRVASSVNLKHHLRILHDLYTRREIAQKALRLYQQSFDQSIDVDDLLTQLQSYTLDLMDFDSSSIITFENSVLSVMEQARLNQGQNRMTGIPTGISKLDTYIGGLQKSDLIIIAGETGFGKTGLALTILRNAIKSGYKAAAYSLEMTHNQLTARIISQETAIPVKKILYGRLDDYEFETLEKFRANGLNGLYYDERSTNTIDNICTSIRKLKVKYDISLVIVDFLQIVAGNEKKNEEAKLAEITRKLKNIAKEQNIAVVALSQLNRDKQHPEPNISRLRGSGQIEEAADVIILLFRPEIYGLKYEEPYQETPTEGTTQLIIGKGRNLGTGTCIVRFTPWTTGYNDYIPEYHGELIREPNGGKESNQF